MRRRRHHSLLLSRGDSRYHRSRSQRAECRSRRARRRSPQARRRERSRAVPRRRKRANRLPARRSPAGDTRSRRRGRSPFPSRREYRSPTKHREPSRTSQRIGDEVNGATSFRPFDKSRENRFSLPRRTGFILGDYFRAGPALTSASPFSLVVYFAKFFTKRAARSSALTTH